MISVNWVRVNARVLFCSVTVIVFPMTLEMTGGSYFGAGVARVFLPPANAGHVANVTREMQRARTNLFFVAYV